MNLYYNFNYELFCTLIIICSSNETCENDFVLLCFFWQSTINHSNCLWSFNVECQLWMENNHSKWKKKNVTISSDRLKQISKHRPILYLNLNGKKWYSCLFFNNFISQLTFKFQKTLQFSTPVTQSRLNTQRE